MSQHGEAIEQNIKSLQSKFNEILTSGHHYFTNELSTRIKQINNALDNIKLDNEFQRGSKNWSKQFDPNEVHANRSNIDQIVRQGHDLVRELNTTLHTTTVQNKEENQLRELHTWAFDSLNSYLQSLHPYASGSYARLDNFAHHLGVTDRYLGYRHNLSRSGTQPIHVNTVWADRTMPTTPDWKNWVHAYQHYAPHPTPSNLPPSGDHQQTLLGYLHHPSRPEPDFSTESPRHIPRHYGHAQDYEQEVVKAGLNLVFPGRTEYMDRYPNPEELPSADFTINPQPDYTLPGRPLARLVPETNPSEYTHSFTFPDGSKIEKFPWLRA